MHSRLSLDGPPGDRVHLPRSALTVHAWPASVHAWPASAHADARGAPWQHTPPLPHFCLAASLLKMQSTRGLPPPATCGASSSPHSCRLTNVGSHPTAHRLRHFLFLCREIYDYIANNAYFLMFAGTDTSSFMLLRVPILLNRHREWFQKMQEEQDRLRQEFGDTIDRKARLPRTCHLPPHLTCRPPRAPLKAPSGQHVAMP